MEYAENPCSEAVRRMFATGEYRDCTYCGFHCDVDATSCPDCGFDVLSHIKEEKTENKSDGQICAGCGRYCSLETTWCPNCAEDLDLRSTKKEMEKKKTVKCEHCASLNDKGETWCYSCQRNLPLPMKKEEKVEKAVKANVVVELSLAEKYVGSWSICDALREVIQNALDEADAGNPLEIFWGSKLRGRLPEGHTNPVSIINNGAKMTRECLLMGGTTKRDGFRKCKKCGLKGSTEQTYCYGCNEEFPKYRGKHGEGFKVAWLVLLRNGLTVRTRVNNEVWTPFMEKSATFGTEILKVKISPAQEVDFISFEIGGLTQETWDEFAKDIIAINPPSKWDAVTVGRSILLKGEKYKGKVFSQGLPVETVENLCWGYDLYELELDRDRKTASSSSLNNCITTLLREALKERLITAQDLMNLPEDCREQDALYSEYNWSPTTEFAETVAKSFTAAYGENAIPVASMEEASMAGQFGMLGVIVPRGLRAVICSHLGKVQQKTRKKEMEAKVVHKMEDINSIEKANLLWAFGLLSQVELWLDLDKVSVVDFHGSRILGTFLASTESVRLNRSVLSDRAELFSTFLHEIAHKYGSDGTDDHRCNIERIAAQVVVNLTKTNAATEEVEKDYTLDELLDIVEKKSENFEDFLIDTIDLLREKLEDKRESGKRLTFDFIEKRKLKGIINLLIDLL